MLDEKRTLKPGSGLDDTKLGRAAADYVMARLKITNGEQPLPLWFQRGCSPSTEERKPTGAKDPGASSTVDSGEGSGVPAPEGATEGASPVAGEGPPQPPPSQDDEVQVYLDKLSHDTWETLEMAPPEGLLDDHPWIAARQAKKESEAAAKEAEASATAATETTKTTAAEEPVTTGYTKAEKEHALAATEVADTNVKSTKDTPSKSDTGKAPVGKGKKVAPMPPKPSVASKEKAAPPSKASSSKASKKMSRVSPG